MDSATEETTTNPSVPSARREHQPYAHDPELNAHDCAVQRSNMASLERNNESSVVAVAWPRPTLLVTVASRAERVALLDEDGIAARVQENALLRQSTDALKDWGEPCTTRETVNDIPEYGVR